MAAAKAPSAVTFDDEDIDEITRAQVALLIKCKPDEVHDMPVRDVYALLDVHAANEEIKAWGAWMAARRR